MMRWIFAVILMLSALLYGEPESSVFSLPDKPASLVCDPAQWLTTHESREWESKLETWKNDVGVEIHLVILPNLHGTPPEYVVREVARRWGDAELCGVVLLVPDGGGPWLWWQGEVIEKVQLDPRAQREMILRMEKKSRSELTERERLGSAVQQLSDTLRLINAQWQRVNHLRDKWNDNIFEKWSQERLQRRARWVTVGTAAIFLSLLLVWWYRRQWIHRRKHFFPRVTAQRRFGAPYAGGSGAVVSLPSSRSSS